MLIITIVLFIIALVVIGICFRQSLSEQWREQWVSLTLTIIGTLVLVVAFRWQDLNQASTPFFQFIDGGNLQRISYGTMALLKE